jgi:hypothetical protein
MRPKQISPWGLPTSIDVTGAPKVSVQLSSNGISEAINADDGIAVELSDRRTLRKANSRR